MSRPLDPNDALSLTVDGGRLLVPLEVARTGGRERLLTITTLGATVRRRLSVALGGVGSRMATFFAAGQLGAGDAVERGRWTGARC